MISEILNFVNVVDIVIAAIFVRAMYVGFKEGFLVELFKLLGMFFATFVTAHYFIKVTFFFAGYIPIPKLALEIFSFVLLWLAVVVLFSFVRTGWLMGFKPQEPSSGSKVFGAILGCARAVLISGMTFLLIFVSGADVFMTTARRSFSGFYLMEVAPEVYSLCYKQCVTKVFPKEPKNAKVFEYFTGKKPESL